MGQYYVLVNLDKKELVDAHQLGGLVKLFEWCANQPARVIPFLLKKSDEWGGGDPHKEYHTCGRWAENRVVLIGDYDSSGLYQEAFKEYTDITRQLVEDFNDFMEEDELKLEYVYPWWRDLKLEEQ